MINFSCKCGHLFNLTEDMAGGLAQCPRCGLLNDVPTLDDLVNMDSDGALKLDDAIETVDHHTLTELHAFSNVTVDSHGQEKDLRPTEDRLRTVGAPPEPDRVVPKYDPYTGELIRPLALKDDALADQSGEPTPLAAMPVLPIPAPKSVSYAAGNLQKNITTATLPLELFMPANAFVMLFIFIFSLLAIVAIPLLAVGSAFTHVSLQVLNFPLWLLIAHYGNVIEATGPDGHDDLPRPLRNVDLVEDIWNPLIRVVRAGALCYFPAVLATDGMMPLGENRLMVILLLALAGSFFLPAVLLTSVTSGTIANFRPDRVLGVINRIGGDYVLSVGVFLLSLMPMPMISLLPSLITAGPFQERVIKLQPYLYMSALAISTYLLHLFCWHLGLMYQAHHDEFPWVMQRHERRTK